MYTRPTLPSYADRRGPAISSDEMNWLDQRARMTYDVVERGADATGVADSGAAFAVNSGLGVLIPQGVYKTDVAPTGLDDWIGIGVLFTGAHPLDEWMRPPTDTSSTAFGLCTMKVVSASGRNALVGAVRNNLPANSTAFPTGLTGYGRNDNNGNAVFPLYAEARQFASTGVVTSEIDSFNHTAPCTQAFPPDRSIGTAQNLPIALTLAAGGSFSSTMAMHIAREGSAPQQFECGIYTSPDAVNLYGILIDSDATHGPSLPLLIKHRAAANGIQVQAVTAPIAGNSWLTYYDGNGVVRLSFKQDGSFTATSLISQTTVGAAGAASALPATPQGYLQFNIGATRYVMPYYLAS